MSTRSRAAFGIIVVAVVIPFFVLWIRTVLQSWNETRTMSLVGTEERSRYERAVQETKKTVGDLKDMWGRVSTPPRVDPVPESVPTSAQQLPEGVANNIEQQLQKSVDQSK